MRCGSDRALDHDVSPRFLVCAPNLLVRLTKDGRRPRTFTPLPWVPRWVKGLLLYLRILQSKTRDTRLRCRPFSTRRTDNNLGQETLPLPTQVQWRHRGPTSGSSVCPPPPYSLTPPGPRAGYPVVELIKIDGRTPPLYAHRRLSRVLPPESNGCPRPD